MSTSHLISTRLFYEAVETAVSFIKKVTHEKNQKTNSFGIESKARFAVVLKTLQETSFGLINSSLIHLLGEKTYIKLQNEGQRILGKVGEVVQRLHIKEEKAVETTRQEVLTTTQTLKMQQVASKYNEIFQKYGNRYAEDLTKKKDILLKTIEHAFEMNKPLMYLAGENHFELGVVGKFLGKGSFGRVSEITTYEKKDGKFVQREEIIKCARQKFTNLGKREAQRTQMKEHAIRDLKNEKRQLDKMPGRVWGVQLAPREIGEITIETSNKAKQRFGYVGFRYHDLNYETYTNSLHRDPSSQSLLFGNCCSEFHQILSGLDYLNKHNRLHGDIKPANIFLKEGYFHIADMGGVCNASITQSIEKLSGVTRSASPAYSAKEDLLKARAIVRQSKTLNLEKEEDRQTYQKLRRQLIDLEKKRDVFSTACVMYKRLTGNLPFKFDSYGFPDLSTYQELKRADIPPEFNALMKQMLHANYKERPSHALRIYENDIKQRFPIQWAAIQRQKEIFVKHV